VRHPHERMISAQAQRASLTERGGSKEKRQERKSEIAGHEKQTAKIEGKGKRLAVQQLPYDKAFGRKVKSVTDIEDEKGSSSKSEEVITRPLQRVAKRKE